jgi:2-polyprenyl-6-methoxyphenol hydroxylase-like FAD-dependent oxidoreductase
MQVVVGAGPVGTAVARLLVDRGEQVKLFRQPFVLDSSAAADAFGIEPIGTDEALRETVTHLKGTV